MVISSENPPRNIFHRHNVHIIHDYSMRRMFAWMFVSIMLVSVIYIITQWLNVYDSIYRSSLCEINVWNSTTLLSSLMPKSSAFSENEAISQSNDNYFHHLTFLLVYMLWFITFVSLFFIIYKAFSKTNQLSVTNSLQDDIIVITGGFGTLGTQLAKVLLYNSATVILLDNRSSINLSELEVSSPGRLFTFPCDVSEIDQVQEVCQFIIDQIGIPTILINNAGIMPQHGPLWELSPETLKDTMSVNFFACIWLIKSLLPKMIKQKRGHIINISSCLGLSGTAFISHYCSSKSALYMAHESLRRELYTLGLDSWIKTTIVCPFFFASNMIQKIRFKWPSITRPLKVQKICNRILKCIKKAKNSGSTGYEQEIWMPWFVYLVPLMKLLPSWLFDWIFHISGANIALLSSEELEIQRISKYEMIDDYSNSDIQIPPESLDQVPIH